MPAEPTSLVPHFSSPSSICSEAAALQIYFSIFFAQWILSIANKKICSFLSSLDPNREIFSEGLLRDRCQRGFLWSHSHLGCHFRQSFRACQSPSSSKTGQGLGLTSLHKENSKSSCHWWILTINCDHASSVKFTRVREYTRIMSRICVCEWRSTEVIPKHLISWFRET